MLGKLLIILLSTSAFMALFFTKNPRRISHLNAHLTKRNDLLHDLVALRSSKYTNAKDAVPVPNELLCSEYFPYFTRYKEESLVVELMHDRQSARLDAKNPYDKSVNRLIAVPGCPGIGKSAFLANFPFSNAFKEYSLGKSPIVSGFTFNGCMKGDPSLGLRILFGAFIFMGVLPVQPFSWKSFSKKYADLFCDDTEDANDAVEILRDVFGRDRPILILIDEVAKANYKPNTPDNARIPAKIGELLDLNGDIDMIVSSLAPQVIKDLLTGSQRKVDFVILPTIMHSGLGQKECMEWTDELTAQLGKRKLPQMKLNLLRNCYLLYSGHPRSLEYMATKFKHKKMKAIWTDIAMKSLSMDPVEILKLLVDKLPFDEDCDLDALSFEELQEHVFLTPSMADLISSSFRLLVNSGKLFVLKKDVDSNTFHTSVMALALLRLNKKLSTHDYKYNQFMSAISIILVEMYECKKFSDLWEQIVDITLLGRSYASKCSLSELFGISLNTHENTRNVWNLDAYVEHNETFLSPVGNSLIIPKSQTSGYDSIVQLYDEKNKKNLKFYLQMKIDSPPGKTLSSLVGAIVVNCILDHCLRSDLIEYPLSCLHIIVYVWGADDKLCHSLSKKKVNAEVKAKTATVMDELMMKSKKKVPLNFHASLVNEFVEKYWEHIHIVGQATLEEWLNPSFLPVAYLIQSL